MKKAIGTLTLALIGLGATTIPAMARERGDIALRRKPPAHTLVYRRDHRGDRDVRLRVEPACGPVR